MSKRDEFGQPIGEWTERDYDLLTILEEVASVDVDPDKTLAAYMADINELFATAVDANTG